MVSRPLLASVVGLCILVVAAGAGCGGGSSSAEGNSSYAIEHGETVNDCLVRLGASFAEAQDQISFFWQAKKSGGVVQVGSAYDPQQDLESRLFVPKEAGTEKWMLWYTQPPSSSQSMREMISRWELWYRLTPTDPGKNDHFDRHLHRNYVMWIIEPTRDFRKEARRCVRFPLTAG